MALNDIHIAAPAERVWAVLSDPHAYGDWVVGAHHVRGSDPGFPAVGTKFYPVIGAGPLRLNAETEVLVADQPRRIVLHAKAPPPLGTAINELVLEDEGAGTRVRFREDPGDRLTKLLFSPLTHLLLRGRNEEGLRRLKALAEGRDPALD